MNFMKRILALCPLAFHATRTIQTGLQAKRGRTMKKLWAALSPTKKNLLVDSIIFLLVLVVDSPHFTGDSLHEWIGLAFGAGILTHLLLHWQWIVASTRNLFGKLARQARIN